MMAILSKKGALVFAMAMLFASSRAFASIPRSMVLDAPSIDRFAVDDCQVSGNDDNALLVARSLAAALPNPPSIASTIDTSPAIVDTDVVQEQLHVFGSHVVIRKLATRAKFFASQSNFSEFSELGQKLRRGMKYQALPFQEPATGLVFARARWYDPQTGAFLSPDPLGYIDSSNLYTFAGGDPVNERDPSGRDDGDIEAREDPSLAPYYEAAEKRVAVPEKVRRAREAGTNAAIRDQAIGVGVSLTPGSTTVRLATRAARVVQATRRDGVVAGAKQAWNEYVGELKSMPFVSTYFEADAASDAQAAHDDYAEAYHRFNTGVSAANDAMLVYGGVKALSAPRVAPRVGPVKEFEVGTYKALSKRAVVGDGLANDHIPSFAALKAAEEVKLGRPLTAAEARALRECTNCIVVRDAIHAESPTTGGRNTRAQIQSDAANLADAAKRDTAALLQNAANEGADVAAAKRAVDALHKANRKAGRYR